MQSHEKNSELDQCGAEFFEQQQFGAALFKGLTNIVNTRFILCPVIHGSFSLPEMLLLLN